MQHDCWSVWPDRGFLLSPDPLLSVRSALDGLVADDILQQIEATANDLPALVLSERIHDVLEVLPLLDLAPVVHERDAVDFRAIERLAQIYGYFASAFVRGNPDSPQQRLPASVAVPLVGLSALVERPPILCYASYVLANWRRGTSAEPLHADNMRPVQNFLGHRDESWFILIHVEIEARAAEAVRGLNEAIESAARREPARLEAALAAISAGLNAMSATFQRMPEGCDTNVYYSKVRPYLFGFDGVIYEGVAAFEGRPQHFRGTTGAQSSIVPALVAGLGLRHEQNNLTHHLEALQEHMPRPHRDFLREAANSQVRQVVSEYASRPALVEAYNDVLRRRVEFRTLHLHFATEYIFRKVSDPRGSGGTPFMDWLKQIRDETQTQLLQPAGVPRMR